MPLNYYSNYCSILNFANIKKNVIRSPLLILDCNNNLKFKK